MSLGIIFLCPFETLIFYIFRGIATEKMCENIFCSIAHPQKVYEIWMDYNKTCSKKQPQGIHELNVTLQSPEKGMLDWGFSAVPGSLGKRGTFLALLHSTYTWLFFALPLSESLSYSPPFLTG